MSDKNNESLVPVNPLSEFIAKLTDQSGFGVDKNKYVKDQKTGLQLLLISLSSQLIGRVSKLRSALDQMVDKLLDEEALRELSGPQLITIYRIMSQTNESYIDFIRSVLRDTDFSSLETSLLQIDSTEKIKESLPQGASVDQVIEFIVQKVKETTEVKVTKTTESSIEVGVGDK